MLEVWDLMCVVNNSKQLIITVAFLNLIYFLKAFGRYLLVVCLLGHVINGFKQDDMFFIHKLHILEALDLIVSLLLPTRPSIDLSWPQVELADGWINHPSSCPNRWVVWTIELSERTSCPADELSGLRSPGHKADMGSGYYNVSLTGWLNNGGD